MRIAVVPSNQHQNQAAGQTWTEETWAVAVCDWLVRRLKDYHCEVGYFHIPGTGAKSTDELAKMLEQAIAWNPDYTISVHSDAVGDAKQTGILMLAAHQADVLPNAMLAHLIAANVGLPFRGVWVYGDQARKIMYLQALIDHRLQGSLVEVGEHGTKAEAEWNWRHIKEIGVGIADALAEYLGLEEDDMSQEQFEKLDRSAQASSFREAIAVAQNNNDYARVARLNDEFYRKFPSGESGLPKGWKPSPKTG